MSSENDIDEEEITEDVGEIISGKKKGKTLTVKHVFQDQRGIPKETINDMENADKTAKENLKLKSQLAVLALSEWNKQKNELMEYVPSEKQEQVENLLEKDPKLIDVLKIQFMDGESGDDGSEPVPPKGKVKAYVKPKKNTVAELYGILSSNQSTREEKKAADAKLDALWKKTLQNKKTVRKSLRGDE